MLTHVTTVNYCQLSVRPNTSMKYMNYITVQCVRWTWLGVWLISYLEDQRNLPVMSLLQDQDPGDKLRHCTQYTHNERPP